MSLQPVAEELYDVETDINELVEETSIEAGVEQLDNNYDEYQVETVEQAVTVSEDIYYSER